eukprot:m.33528 g.33528  ORF g.33528 m.33528 type:complete len:145 (+) comp31844_c0_seq1:22-456(+)
MALARIGHRMLAASRLRLGVAGMRMFSNEELSKEQLEKLVKKEDVVVFMKGVPAQPMCGFSNAVVQILKMHGVDNYASFNILEDDNLKRKMKEFSNWPTFPQVYIQGELVGGCDIMLQMHQSGELVEALKKIGIHSALLDEDAN